jgi:hypothetical protein
MENHQAMKIGLLDLEMGFPTASNYQQYTASPTFRSKKRRSNKASRQAENEKEEIPKSHIIFPINFVIESLYEESNNEIIEELDREKRDEIDKVMKWLF